MLDLYRAFKKHVIIMHISHNYLIVHMIDREHSELYKKQDHQPY